VSVASEEKEGKPYSPIVLVLVLVIVLDLFLYGWGAGGKIEDDNEHD
jgi:hypothetical protein